MIRASVRVRLPNPHEGDISREFLARILRQADVSRAEWERFLPDTGYRRTCPEWPT